MTKSEDLLIYKLQLELKEDNYIQAIRTIAELLVKQSKENRK